MTIRPRFYDTLLREHLAQHRQMALVSGPRQVGKTTTCREVADSYLNWDNVDDRRQLLCRIASPNFLTGCLTMDLTGRRRYGMLQWCRQVWSLPRTRANSLPQEATMPPASVR